MGYGTIKPPRFCYRQAFVYERCLIANDDNDKKCDIEKNNILSICPAFSLDTMKNNTLQQKKVEALNNLKYKEAMKVGEYNNGRTVANVPRKKWTDGSRENIRPDTLWADERYLDVTQKDIDEAKVRIKKRNEEKGIKTNPNLNVTHYDR